MSLRIAQNNYNILQMIVKSDYKLIFITPELKQIYINIMRISHRISFFLLKSYLFKRRLLIKKLDFFYNHLEISIHPYIYIFIHSLQPKQSEID